MKRFAYLFLISLCCLLVFSASMFRDEGMWLLNQLDKLPWKEMQKHGLELTPEQIYNPNGPSLTDAVMLLDGGTSTFVSADGLILTNHHVAYAGIQTVTSVHDDYLRDGYLAKTREDEISIPSYNAQIVIGMKDVTSDILSAISDTMSPLSRASAIQVKSADIAKKEKGTSDNECRVSEMYNGLKYILFTYQVLKDVRLVYAPPASIGNYGGEIDNWYWPRHTGDFSFMRAYVSPDGKGSAYSKQNVPFKPKKFLPFSIDGFKEGDFELILGFPGRTFRYRTATEIQLAKEETLPMTIDLFKTRMDIMDAAGKKDRAVEIKYATRWRGLANTYKNYQGTLEGMVHADILKQRKEREQQFQQFIQSNPDLEKKYSTVLKDIADAYAELKAFNKKATVFPQILGASDLLQIARRFTDYANSFAKDSTGKEKPTQVRMSAQKDATAQIFKNFDLNVDKEVLTALLLKGADLPPGQQIDRVQRIVGSRMGEEREKTVREFVDDLCKHSKLTSAEDCERMMTKSRNDILDDDIVKFLKELDVDNAPVAARTMAFNAKIGLLRTKLMEAWTAWKRPDLYPDANRTLRLTYGEVKSYNPRDAVHYKEISTLGGVMEKETGEDPFIVPPKLRELWEKKDFGKYADPSSGDVPVAFLADLDITGGNSGSAVINGKGEISGIAFDGNWEAVVGDYLFQEPLNRTISVDARYILFILDKYANAQNVLQELVVKSSTMGNRTN